ncbi:MULTISPECIES: hypothetical protein [unclassified Methanoculleus]|uniref:hypothetical protein n=1 Tax=unclassified Methanoculleus TaxID=2619537 RepID=UPI00316AD9C7
MFEGYRVTGSSLAKERTFTSIRSAVPCRQAWDQRDAGCSGRMNGIRSRTRGDMGMPPDGRIFESYGIIHAAETSGKDTARLLRRCRSFS